MKIKQSRKERKQALRYIQEKNTPSNTPSKVFISLAIFGFIFFSAQFSHADCICVCENGRGKALCESRYESKNCALTKCPPAFPNTPNPYYQPHAPQGYYYNPTPPQHYYNPPHPHYPPPYPHYPPPR